jgi:amino-acid N-acetyltransferase
MKISKANVKDAIEIHKLINHFAGQGCMLARALSDIYEGIREYFVAREDGQIIGCVALHVSWLDLAEIRSLAVQEKNQHQGVAVLLIDACIDEACQLGIDSLFCLTQLPDFFKKKDFQLVDRAELPHKIWTDCYRCPKHPDCNSVALICRTN